MKVLMYQFNQTSRIRPHYIDKNLDSFKRTEVILPEMVAQELIAYYRGEVVTPSFIEQARSVLCSGGSPPIPLVPIGSVTIKCNDVEDTFDVAMETLARNYDLIRDLYELDPTMKEFSLPFDIAEVVLAITEDYRSACYMSASTAPIPLLKFLRPRRTEQYLDYGYWSEDEITEDFCRMVGSGLEEETRMHLSKYASVLPDRELYPIVAKLADWNHIEGLSKLLSEKAPSVLFWCYISCTCDDCEDAAVELIRSSSFEDTLQVVQPRQLQDWQFMYLEELDRKEETKFQRIKRLYTQVLASDNEETCRRVLIVLGEKHPSLKPMDPRPTLPFGCDWKCPLHISKRTYERFKMNITTKKE